MSPSIDARVTRVEQNQNGWYLTSTDDPNVKRLDTKREDIAREAQKAMQQNAPARLEYTERESTNINPHTNQPYPPSRFLDKVTILGERPADIPMVASTRAKLSDDEAWRICLTVGAKLAVQTLPMMPTSQRDFETQWRIAVAWAERLFFSVAPERPAVNGANPHSTFQTPAAAVTGDPGAYPYPPPPQGDDDIPF